MAPAAKGPGMLSDYLILMSLQFGGPPQGSTMALDI